MAQGSRRNESRPVQNRSLSNGAVQLRLNSTSVNAVVAVHDSDSSIAIDTRQVRTVGDNCTNITNVTREGYPVLMADGCRVDGVLSHRHLSSNGSQLYESLLDLSVCGLSRNVVRPRASFNLEPEEASDRRVQRRRVSGSSNLDHLHLTVAANPDALLIRLDEDRTSSSLIRTQSRNDLDDITLIHGVINVSAESDTPSVAVSTVDHRPGDLNVVQHMIARTLTKVQQGLPHVVCVDIPVKVSGLFSVIRRGQAGCVLDLEVGGGA
mmetsp:Transcript_6461/g.12854  ORF Transcript_6461/g.12854 Transcript_6461/m.12854 type:complete len:266 (+) Transcript_6461:2362-3159(+)